jgi:hypothetical protein
LVLVGTVALPSPGHTTSSGATGASQVDSQAASSLPDAHRIAAAFKHQVQVTSLDATTSTTFANPDGTVSSRLYPAPIRTEQNGQLVAIDPTLVPKADGSVVPRAIPNDVVLSGGGSGPLVTLSQGSSRVSYSWAGRLPAPVLSGGTATYPEVALAEDLRVTVTAGGVETFLIFRAKPGPAQARLQLSVSVSDGSVSTDPAGHTVFRDATGKQLAVGSVPAAWDARVNPASGDVTPVLAATSLAAPGTSRSSRIFAPTAAPVTGVQNVQLPASLLNDPATVYPVTLDPDTPFNQYTFAYIDSNNPDQTYVASNWDSGQVHMGAEPGTGGINRPMWIFSAGGLVGAKVTQALFKTNETHAWNCTAQPVQLWNTGGWGQGLTWNNQPTANGSWASASFASGYTGCAGVQETINATTLVQTLVTEQQVNYYLQLRAGDESNQQQWKKFSTSGTYLEVTYDHYPSAPAGRSVSPCGFSCGSTVLYSKDGKPMLTGVSSDSDTDNLSYNFEVYSGFAPDPATQSPVAIGSTPALSYGTSGQWQPVRLPDGSYSYRVQANDGTVNGPWSVGWVNFVVDTSTPATPTLSVPVGGPFSTDPNSFTGVIGQDTETVTLSNPTADHVYGYAYWLQAGGTPVSPSNINCSTGQTVQQDGFTETCLASGQTSTAATFSATSETSALYAVAFDLAGNTSNPSGQAFYAQQDTAAFNTSWNVSGGGGSSCPSGGPVPEFTATSAGALGLTGSACWQSVPATVGPNKGVLQFPGTAATAATASAVLTASTSGDAASFSVGVWVRPTSLAGTQSVMGQDLAHESTFYLQGYGGRWMFCVPGTDATTWAASAGDCIYSSNGSEVVNQWTHLEGVWDRINKQLRIYVSTGGASTPAGTGSHSSVPVGTAGLVLGRNRVSDGYRYFTGQICDPSAMRGVIGTGQLSLVAAAGAPCTKANP